MGSGPAESSTGSGGGRRIGGKRRVPGAGVVAGGGSEGVERIQEVPGGGSALELSRGYWNGCLGVRVEPVPCLTGSFLLSCALLGAHTLTLSSYYFGSALVVRFKLKAKLQEVWVLKESGNFWRAPFFLVSTPVLLSTQAQSRSRTCGTEPVQRASGISGIRILLRHISLARPRLLAQRVLIQEGCSFRSEAELTKKSGGRL